MEMSSYPPQNNAAANGTDITQKAGEGRRFGHSTRPLVFVKTHKTASTTLANIINRYGYSNNLSFLLYKNDPTRGHFRQRKLRGKRDILPPIGVQTLDYKHYRDYDLMTSHIRLLPNLNFLKHHMRSGARFITILREPTKQFTSAFFFFKCPEKYSMAGKTPSQLVDTFLRRPFFHWNRMINSYCKIYIRNGMFYDLISEELIHKSVDVINKAIRKLDGVLDLVLITEYLDQSLLLLKKIMSWEFEDILYLRANQRAERSGPNREQRIKIRRWNMADTLLYKHYNHTLWKKIAKYDGDFEADLKHFRSMLQDYYEMCNVQTVVAGTKIARKVDRNASQQCKNIVSVDLESVVTRQRAAR
ncbi:galactosylceramide sulfotransferase-like [Diadema antillarum]|uniref:galactosylceramide sulfotransferase-like n=1 Tax=Diadema antillarum TaxID=105358 RepID=UPI003A83D206